MIKKTTIMVIEDEPLLLQAITKKLQFEGFEVLSCTGGQQALDYLNQISEMPNAIWLDYYLKDMNGLLFMEQLKSNDNWRKIPVLVVSNSAGPEKVKNMMELGANKYILKAEYQLDQIIKIMEELINNQPKTI